MAAHFYIGIMSGTSADGADLALVSFACEQGNNYQLHAHYYQPYSDELHQRVTDLYNPSDNELDRAAVLGIELAHFYASAVNQLLDEHNLSSDDIVAIGCHGQTIRHRPTITDSISQPFTWQMASHQHLACLTGIRVIGNFREKDIALGGQGAPLVPAFHQYIFAKPAQDTFIVNLGGIANITFLPGNSDKPVLGFDTGPANALLDLWCQLHTDNRFDQDGQWAATGKVHTDLLRHLLADNYFQLAPPKSTGREYFNLAWLEQKLAGLTLSPADIQATLVALTAESVCQQIKLLSPKGFVYLCGGGLYNLPCYKHIEQTLTEFSVEDINSLNVNNNAFEAMAFAWLAYAYDKKFYGNIPTVTGASKQTVLGVEYTP